MTPNSRVLLVVDDDPRYRRSLSRLLASDFGRVLTASNPTEALAIVAEQQVSAVLSDFNFGPDEIDGCKLAIETKRQLGEEVCFVVITGEPASRLEPQPEVDGVLSKSATIEEIRAAVLSERLA